MGLQFSLEPLEILRWIGLVFAAGFIGYFGRYLSMLILDRIHKKRAETPPTTETPGETVVSAASQAERERLKLGKKKLKQEKKRAKKVENT